jgi:Protein of unknown function (DUF2442)
MLNVTAVRHLRDYVLWLRFNDGREGEVDLRAELDGPVFEPLRDVALFAQAHVHPDLRTVVWPNGADFAPEFLYQQMRTLQAA